MYKHETSFLRCTLQNLDFPKSPDPKQIIFFAKILNDADSFARKWAYQVAIFNAELTMRVLKVSKFQNEIMKSSFLPKYEQKIVEISALTTQGRNPDNFWFVFWEKR